MGISGTDIGMAAAAGLKALGEGMQENARGGKRGGGGLDAKIASSAAEVAKAVEETKRTLSKRDATTPDNTVVMKGEPEGIMGRKKGGKIPRTGIYKLHKGEFVLPARAVKRLEKRKAARSSGRR